MDIIKGLTNDKKGLEEMNKDLSEKLKLSLEELSIQKAKNEMIEKTNKELENVISGNLSRITQLENMLNES